MIRVAWVLLVLILFAFMAWTCELACMAVGFCSGPMHFVAGWAPIHGEGKGRGAQ